MKRTTQVTSGRILSTDIFNKLCVTCCPLETLILLNTTWKALGEKNDHDSNAILDYNKTGSSQNVEHNISKFAEKISASKGFQRLIGKPSYVLPVSLKKAYFSSMGFEDKEIRHLLISDEGLQFQSSDSEGKILRYTNPNYLLIMKDRLDILRENGPKMGLLTPSDYFKVMKNWSKFLKRLGDTAKQINSSSKQSTSAQDNDKLDPVATTIVVDVAQELINSTERIQLDNVLTYLQEYFSNGESQKQLRQDIFELPQYERFSAKNIKNVKTHQIGQTLNWLESQGFCKSQIRGAMPLIFYHPALLEQKLVELEEMEEFQQRHETPEGMSNSNTESNCILQVLLYLIEKEFSFTDEGTYFAQRAHEKAKSLNEYFTESLCDEILKYSGVQLVPTKRAHECFVDDSQRIFEDLSAKNLPLFDLDKIHFQDYIYLHDPNSNHNTKTCNKLNGTLKTTRSKTGLSSVQKKAVRLFSSTSDSMCLSEPHQSRSMSTNTPNDRRDSGKSWAFIYSNPFTWIDMKLQYYAITNTLDNNFSEQDFKRGAKQVIFCLPTKKALHYLFRLISKF